MRLPLEGRAFVVIGGTSGLGLSAVRALVGSDARVVSVGRDPDKVEALRQELGAAGRVLAGDAVDPSTAESAITECLGSFGRFDGLYHVAGGSGRRFGDGPLHTISDDGWDRTLDLNLKSIFLSNRAAVRRLLDRKQSGSVVNCGSVLGFSPSPHFFTTHAYAAAKAALIGLTRSAAAHYAGDDIRFNVVAPALVATPMSRRAQESSEIQAFIRTKQPLDGGRMGVPEDLDAAVLWLLSEASRFVTGQVISVDGGWTVSEGQIPQPDKSH
jgi:NAD(P)-dependent dehydrogenase (short-subunit alcohol dehydrogenase family)